MVEIASENRIEPGVSTAAEFKPFVSVIIPAHNESDHLRRCIESFAKQDYPAYEVILVDNASTDDTAKVCAEFPFVKYVYFDKSRSSYAARNEGVRHALGQIIAFFDADQHACANYLSMLLAEYVPNDPYHIYVGRLADDESVPLVLRRFFSPDAGPVAPDASVGTAAVALPRTLFDEFGGFREELLSGGDFEFFDRATKIAKVHRDFQISAYHCWALSVEEYLSREERYAFGQCLRAEFEGRPTPSLTRATLEFSRIAVRKGAASAMVPFRYPRSEWRLRWHGQLLHCQSQIRRCMGIAKFKLGFKRAGDLPKQ